MKVKELSLRANVSIPTIKYYLREGLLPKGEPLGETKAEYGEEHLTRLLLIRTLVETGEVPIARIRHLLDAIDDENLPARDLLAAAMHAAAPDARTTAHDDSFGDRTGAEALLAHEDWKSTSDGRDQLARALAGLRRIGLPADPDKLGPYLDAAKTIAAQQLPLLPAPEERAEFAVRAVLGAVLYERLLATLIRIATENAR
ncbi:MerR family transcriptional regulator [Amycolatopsis sp. NPDC059021]|uniref:MerR family transcriptional regulator n=1 Tax=Amycolatopsis sp. NPDC059021 TaxID=3346704 RepID=UPI00366C7128